MAVYDSTPTPEGNKGWEVIGGTSVASPIIASVFALAGGAHGVAYPARTLYEDALSAPTALHDVSEGSNGECLKPFNEVTATIGCSPAETGSVCSEQAICVAGSGYDGPTGVGTPNGIAAFTPSAEAQAKGGAEESETGGESIKPPSEERRAPTPAPAPSGSSPSPIPGTSPVSKAASGPPTLSALGLTLKAVIALNGSRPRVSQVGFVFTSSAPVRVRVTLARRYVKRGHVHWATLRTSVTLNAMGGRNSARLSGSGVLKAGRYRLTVTPIQGVARTMIFQIG